MNVYCFGNKPAISKLRVQKAIIQSSPLYLQIGCYHFLIALTVLHNSVLIIKSGVVLFIQLSAPMVMFALLEARISMKVEWRYVSTISGGQCVMTSGEVLKHGWYAGN